MNTRGYLTAGLLLTVCFAPLRAQPTRPNILFAITDDHSWMHASAYGDKSTQTPAFDRIAREGVLFNHAYCASPSCAPSRAAILTGRHIWQLEEGGTLFGILNAKKFPAFTRVLAGAGYELGNTGKTYRPGRVKGGPPGGLIGRRYNARTLQAPQPGIDEIDYATNFEDFLKERDKTKPFFFWYGATEPHQVYDIGAWKRAGKKLEDALLPGCLPDDPVTRGEMLDYSLEIEHFDRHLARMIELLEQTGELARTLVVVTSDHGNPMPRSKCNLYDSGIRVPLAIRWPGRIPGGRKVDDFVQLTDLAPTLLEAADANSLESISGRSLWPVLSSNREGIVDETRNFVVTAFERHIFCRRGGVGYPMRSIRTRNWAYIRNYEPDRWPAGDPDYNSSHQVFYGDVDQGESKRFMIAHAMEPEVRPYFLRAFGRRPAEELYHMINDPHQLNNLAADPKHAEIKAELAGQLHLFLQEHGDPRQSGQTPWDNYPFTDYRSEVRRHIKGFFENPNWKTEGFPSQLK